ncbi:hypothetical protein ACL02T_15170 [Pseudonocardia sp. RS010]|uniref:hypothetical protein n=1 Tax=Pseudonocardia sp. RS010 TaxID=3385979 RepID=UPI0039A26EE0
MSLLDSRRAHRLALVPVGLVAAAVLAACGSSTDQTSSTSGSTAASGSSTADTSGTADAFQACLAENGVEAPAGGPGGGGPGGGGPGGGGPGGRGGTPPSGAPEAGGTPPEGAPQDGGAPPQDGTMQAPPGVDEATWTAATEACADLAPTPSPATAG